MKNKLTQKLQKLENEKLKIDSEIKELKQQQVQELSAFFTILCEDHSLDPMTLLGSLLETIKDTKTITQKKEEWLKATTSFRSKNRIRMSSLLAQKT